MAMTYKARRRWSLVVLLIGLPLYIAAALFVVSLFDRPSLLVEFFVYVGLGMLWIVPLKKVFLGVGQAEPDAGKDTQK
ncbi:DUF2842 domain-containing protein [Pseudorhodobacter ferrugineus]|uniref:DUF2842 domain-containing protein n=1 Tax=Pseudorhodobacter ferrugineus TaxID=77008 RepID=UPI000401463F|nr:DUF2842 domain-containing protein [Pseudorhodobacter ferrugineus]